MENCRYKTTYNIGVKTIKEIFNRTFKMCDYSGNIYDKIIYINYKGYK